MIKQGWTTEDGMTFATKAEALEWQRLPQVKAALNEITSNNDELVKVLIDEKEAITSSFDVGTIRRVKSAEKKRLVKAFDAIEKADIAGAEYLFEPLMFEGQEYQLKDILIDSWKWPKVQRLDDEEKNEKARDILSKLELSPEVVEFILEKKEEILEAYEAGKEKRQISPKALEKLEEYRQMKAAEKAAAA
jgi:translation elongation factor EF-G